MGEPDAQFEACIRRALEGSEQDDQFSMNLDLWQCGLDSVALVELMVDLEQHYEIEFSDEDMVPETFHTPLSLWSTIAKRLAHA